MIIGFFIGAIFVLSQMGDYEKVKNVGNGKFIEHDGNIYKIIEVNKEEVINL